MSKRAYERTYILLPQQYREEPAWAIAAARATALDGRTIGYSADDAGIDHEYLDSCEVIAVNPRLWPGDLEAFVAEYYPRATYTPIGVSSPAELERVLSGDVPVPGPPAPGALATGLHDQAGADWMLANHRVGVALVLKLVHVQPLAAADVDFRRYAEAGIDVYLRLGWGYADGSGTLPAPEYLPAWVEAISETCNRARGIAGVTVGNEINNPSEWTGGYPSPTYHLTPEYYVQAYNDVALLTGVPLAPAPLDPYNVVAAQFGIMADPADWARYIYARARRVDWIALHAKTQGAEPRQCDPTTAEGSAVFGDAPLVGRYQNLRTIEDQLAWIPQKFAAVPKLVTELNPQRRRDGSLGWDTDGAEWVRAALDYCRSQPLGGAMFYRFERAGDQAGFGLDDRPDVLQSIFGGN